MTLLTDELREKIRQLSSADEGEVYADYGRALATGAFETDPEEEGRRRFPHFVNGVRRRICESPQVCALLDEGRYYETAHVAAIVCEILLDIGGVSTYAAPSAAVLCAKHGLHRLCRGGDEPGPG